MERSTELQKLRAFAILMVLFGHTPLSLPGFLVHGYTGVSLFFVLSGYVVTLSFMRSFDGAKQSGDVGTVVRCVRDFFIRRFFRIVPVAVLWLFIYFFIGQLINYCGGSYGSLSRWFKELSWFASGFFNYFFAKSHAPGLFGHYWSLAVEMQFYFVLPFLLVFFRSRKSRIWLCLAGIFLVSTLLRAITPPDEIGMLTHTQADALLAGVLLCVLFAGKAPGPEIGARPASKIPLWAKRSVFAVLILALFLLPYKLDGRLEPILKYPILTLVAASIVFLAQRNTEWILGRMPLTEKFLLFIADRSYSIYVCHIILFSGVYSFLQTRYGGALPAWVISSGPGITFQLLLLFALAILMGDVSYRVIELPYIDYGKKIIKSFAMDEKARAINADHAQP